MAILPSMITEDLLDAETKKTSVRTERFHDRHISTVLSQVGSESVSHSAKVRISASARRNRVDSSFAMLRINLFFISG